MPYPESVSLLAGVPARMRWLRRSRGRARKKEQKKGEKEEKKDQKEQKKSRDSAIGSAKKPW